MSTAVAVGLLTSSGTFLLLQPGLVRKVLGFALLQHAFNVLLVMAGGTRRRAAAIAGESGAPGDPLTQGLTLTAIVIGLGMTAFLVSLAFDHAVREREESSED